MKATTLSIIGLDRTGAAIGLAAGRANVGLTRLGFDGDRQRGQRAQALGAVDKALWSLPQIVEPADILILNLPLGEMAELLTAVAPHVQPHCLLLDLSPLKQRGLALAQKYLTHGHYVGVAPIYAAKWLFDGRTDLESAQADLFQNSLLALTPAPEANPQAVETAVNFGRLLGAQPFFLDAAEYDSLAYALESVPGLLAAALFNALTKQEGWRDRLRLAGRPFALATAPLSQPDLGQLALQEKETTLRWLDHLLAELTAVREQVAHGEAEIVKAILTEMGREQAAWIAEREANHWDDQPPIERITLGQQLLGGLAPGGKAGKRHE
jgi:prephenate dehydrogenase